MYLVFLIILASRAFCCCPLLPPDHIFPMGKMTRHLLRRPPVSINGGCFHGSPDSQPVYPRENGRVHCFSFLPITLQFLSVDMGVETFIKLLEKMAVVSITHPCVAWSFVALQASMRSGCLVFGQCVCFYIKPSISRQYHRSSSVLVTTNKD